MKKNSRRRVLYASIAIIIIAGISIMAAFDQSNRLVRVTIPPGLRKEETAAILAADLKWTPAQKQEFMGAYMSIGSSSADYAEGVYFPDTYLIPAGESPATTSERLIDEFNEQFAPYQAAALDQNIKWTVLLTMASIIQREAASSSDMALISGILWNRLEADMPLDVDSTVQYARGDREGTTTVGWWAPVTPADLSIDSPYNTYIYKGLPPHPIDSPGLDAIKAALNPASTTCVYYLHDSSGNIHCSDTYAGQQANVKEYLQ